MVTTTTTESATSKAKSPARKANGRDHGRGGRKAKSKASGRGRQQRQSATSALSSYGSSASRYSARGRDALSGAYSWADSAARELPGTLPDMASIRSMANERPLMLGAIGLGIGLLIGVMWPANSMMSWQSSGRQRGGRRSGRR